MDQFAFAAAPQILRQPLAATVNQGASINLSVLASGSPTLGYQWQQNGNPVGGNNSFLTMSNVGRAQNGIYCVTVTNAGGAVVSSNAVVHVNVPQLLGMPVLLPDGSLQLTSSDVNGGALSPSDLPSFEAQASTDLVIWVNPARRVEPHKRDAAAAGQRLKLHRTLLSHRRTLKPALHKMPRR